MVKFDTPGATGPPLVASATGPIDDRDHRVIAGGPHRTAQ